MKTDETNFLYTITSIRQRIFKYLENELTKAGIRDVAPSFGDILFVLDLKGPLTMQELARLTMKDKSTVSSVVSKLEKAGFVRKDKGMEDARFTTLSLTPKASDLRPVLMRISDSMNAMLFNGFSAHEKNQLFELIQRIADNV
jgi:DNA-binding MarR family transcriptional regulator